MTAVWTLIAGFFIGIGISELGITRWAVSLLKNSPKEPTGE